MKNNILVVLMLVILTLTTKAQEVIVSPQWVNDNLSDPNLVIVQPSFLKLDYDNEHIKGARYLWPDWLTANSPEGTYNPPDAKDATKVLQGLGINKNSKIVLCCFVY